MTEQQTRSLPKGASRREAALAGTLPHLSIEAKSLAQNYPSFLERLQAFLSNPDDDPTGLRLFNLLTYAQGLQRSMEQVVALLGQVDASRTKQTAQSQASDEQPEESAGEWWER